LRNCSPNARRTLADRGIDVDLVTIYRWVRRFTPLLADAARFARHSPGDR
jgi:transposase-like protein